MAESALGGLLVMLDAVAFLLVPFRWRAVGAVFLLLVGVEIWWATLVQWDAVHWTASLWVLPLCLAQLAKAIIGVTLLGRFAPQWTWLAMVSLLVWMVGPVAIGLVFAGQYHHVLFAFAILGIGVVYSVLARGEFYPRR